MTAAAPATAVVAALGSVTQPVGQVVPAHVGLALVAPPLLVQVSAVPRVLPVATVPRVRVYPVSQFGPELNLESVADEHVYVASFAALSTGLQGVQEVPSPSGLKFPTGQ